MIRFSLAVVVLTGLVTFTWGMLFAFYLIFVRMTKKLITLLEDANKKRKLTMHQLYSIIIEVIDSVFERLEGEKDGGTQRDKK